MKKFLVVLITLLFAASAFAQDAAKAESKGPEFKYGFYGLSFLDNTSATAGKAKTQYNYAHVRVKPSFSLGNENVKGVVIFEIDQNLGGPADAGADKGTDNKVVEVKHAYFQVKDAIIPGLTLKTGLFGYAAPLLIDNDFGMAQASFDFGMGNINFNYIPTMEGNVYNKTSDTEKEDYDPYWFTGRTTYRDDVTTYGVDALIKAGFVNITPVYLYTKFGAGNKTVSKAADATKFVAATTYDEDVFSFADGSMWNAGISADGEIEGLGFSVAYSVAKGKADYTVMENPNDSDGVTVGTDKIAQRKISTHAFDAAVSYKIDPLKVEFFYTQYSGNRSRLDSTKETKYQSHIALMDNVFGAPDGRLFLLDANGTQNLGGTNAFDFGDFGSGLKIYGVDAELNIAKLTLFAQYGYVLSEKKYRYETDRGVNKRDNKVGQEVDLKAAVEVAPKTSVFVEYGYGQVSKHLTDTQSTQNINSVVAGMKTSF
jgi:hypothetical protein